MRSIFLGLFSYGIDWFGDLTSEFRPSLLSVLPATANILRTIEGGSAERLDEVTLLLPEAFITEAYLYLYNHAEEKIFAPVGPGGSGKSSSLSIKDSIAPVSAVAVLVGVEALPLSLDGIHHEWQNGRCLWVLPIALEHAMYR
ncbi:unnamed protein product [Ilex paraguariensis]|uniref:Uncharacterized protein n=1 Tax=Ilex paraguariensis TaxID=185542 RepID=A0ABC8R2R2_9AQUA